MIFFHGTNCTAAKSILNNGFNEGFIYLDNLTQKEELYASFELLYKMLFTTINYRFQIQMNSWRNLMQGMKLSGIPDYKIEQAGELAAKEAYDTAGKFNMSCIDYENEFILDGTNPEKQIDCFLCWKFFIPDTFIKTALKRYNEGGYKKQFDNFFGAEHTDDQKFKAYIKLIASATGFPISAIACRIKEYFESTEPLDY